MRGRFADLGRGPGVDVLPPLVPSPLMCGDPDGCVAAARSGSGGAVLLGEALGVPLTSAASEGPRLLGASRADVDLRPLRPAPVLRVGDGGADDVVEEGWSRDGKAGGAVGAGRSGGSCEPVPLVARAVCRPSGSSPEELCCSAARHAFLCMSKNVGALVLLACGA